MQKTSQGKCKFHSSWWWLEKQYFLRYQSPVETRPSPCTCSFFWGLDANSEPVCQEDKAEYCPWGSVYRYLWSFIHLFCCSARASVKAQFTIPHCWKADNQETIMARESRTVKIRQSFLRYLLITKSVALSIYLDSLSLFPYLQFKILILVLRNCCDH